MDASFAESLHSSWLFSLLFGLFGSVSIVGFFVVLVLNRRIRQEKLRSEQLFKVLPSAVYTVDLKGRITSWNEMARALTGYEGTEVMGRTSETFRLKPLDDGGDVELSALDIGGSVRGRECVIRRKGGRICTVIVNSDVILDERGRKAASIISFSDISIQKKLLDATNRARQEWEKTFDAVPDLIAILDKNHRILKVNKAMADKMGVTPEAAEGMHCYESVHGLEKPPDFCPHVRLLADQKFHETEIYEERLGGYYTVTVSPLLAEDKTLWGSVHVAHDTTARHLADDKMKEIMEAKSKFTSVVSHELRTPLTAMKESLNIVLSGSTGPINDDQKDFLDTAKRNVDRLARLINDVLDFQKLEAGKMVFDLKENDIAAIIEELVKTMRPVAQEKGLELKFRFGEGLPQVRCDRDKIVQVLTNLVNNAIKFTAHGSVTVSADPFEDHVRITIEDTGPGIKADDLSKLFQSFSQLENAKDRKGGTGLGLAISKEIVEHHHGKIWVESEVGRGTRFIFNLYLSSVERQIEEFIGAQDPARRDSGPLTLFSVRIDRYPELAAALGETKVQELSLRLHAALEGAIRRGDFFAAKDESQFVVVNQVGPAKAPEVRERFKRAMKKVAFEMGDQVAFDFSTGVAFYPGDGREARPLWEKAAARQASESSERLKKQILLVDDEAAVRHTMRRMMELLGYRNILEADDGDKVFDVLATATPDLVILDMMLPKINGYEVIGRLKGDQKTKNIPVLIFSGHEIHEDRLRDYVQNEALPMLGKPVESRALERWLYHLL